MSYIVPDGRIQLFKNIPLAPDNENTLYFFQTSTKDAYFDSLQQNNNYSLGTFDNATYSREERGFVRINTQVGSVYNACYMRFKNTSFENKWFYAFVTSVEYIANKTVQINYSIDYMMTYMGDFELEYCLIERETVADDRIGLNIIDEGLEIGDYVNENVINLNELLTYEIVVVVADPNELQNTPVNYNVYNPCHMEHFSNAQTASQYINTLVNAALGDNILGVCMIPKEYASIVENNSTSHTKQITRSVTKPLQSLNNYVPKNNKMFVYPYKRLIIDNIEGATQEYKYEFFNQDADGIPSSGNCEFQEVGCFCGTAEVILSPKQYMNSAVGSINYGARIGRSHYPECAWAMDSYKAYRAQINSNLPFEQRMGKYMGAFEGGVSGAAQGGDVPLIGNIISAVTGAAAGAASGYYKPAVEAMVVNRSFAERGSIVKGSQAPTAVFAADGCTTFKAYKQCIDRPHAKSIDDFFTMFGYKVNRVDRPNMNIRPHWTYIKTIGCIVNGEMPADYMRAIEARFNAGVRFWKNINDFGNFTLDNRASTR